MASYEGSVYQNPIRFCGLCMTGSKPSYEKVSNVFNNQIPGTYIVAANDVTYWCTKYVTSLGEPIWVSINQYTLKPNDTYQILSKQSDKTEKAYSVDQFGNKIEYTTSSVVSRINGTKTLVNSSNFDSYFFLTIQESEYAYISSLPSPMTNSGISVFSGYDHAFDSAITESSGIGNAEMYNYLREDSNGRSGFGATYSRDGVFLPNKQGSSSASGQAAYTVINNGNNRLFNNGIDLGADNSSDQIISPVIGAVRNFTQSPVAGALFEETKPSPDGKKSEVEKSKSPSVSVVFTRTFAKNSPDSVTKRDVSFSTPSVAEKPYMQQTYEYYPSVKFNKSGEAVNTRKQLTNKFYFDIVPNSINFSDVGSDWREVERAGNFSLVDWSRYKLTKVSFQFTVANENDGLVASINNQIEKLKIMAALPVPIQIFNFDNPLLQYEYRYPFIMNTANIYWTIQDLSISVTRMTPPPKYEMSAATVNITLIETPHLRREIIPLPPLTGDNPKKQCKTNCSKTKTIGLFQDTLTIALEKISGNGDLSVFMPPSTATQQAGG